MKRVQCIIISMMMIGLIGISQNVLAVDEEVDESYCGRYVDRVLFGQNNIMSFDYHNGEKNVDTQPDSFTLRTDEQYISWDFTAQTSGLHILEIECKVGSELRVATPLYQSTDGSWIELPLLEYRDPPDDHRHRYFLIDIPDGTSRFKLEFAGEIWNMFYAYGAKLYEQANGLPDTNPPVVIDHINLDLTNTTSHITWLSDEPASAIIHFGTDTNVSEGTVLDSQYLLEHDLTITGLNPLTHYYYTIQLDDELGNSQTFGPFEFDTKEYAFNISNTRYNAQTENSVTILWQTKVEASSIVHYGTTTSLGSIVQDLEPSRDHLLRINGLTNDTIYYFKIQSVDEYGNPSYDDNNGNSYRFKTCATDQRPLVIEIADDGVDNDCDGFTDDDDPEGSYVVDSYLGTAYTVSHLVGKLEDKIDFGYWYWSMADGDPVSDDHDLNNSMGEHNATSIGATSISEMSIFKGTTEWDFTVPVPGYYILAGIFSTNVSYCDGGIWKSLPIPTLVEKCRLYLIYLSQTTTRFRLEGNYHRCAQLYSIQTDPFSDASLEPTHPTLFVKSDEIEALKTKIDSVEILSNTTYNYKYFLLNGWGSAPFYLTMDYSAWDHLVESREFANGISYLSLAYLLTDEIVYAEKAIGMMLLASSWPGWGRDFSVLKNGEMLAGMAMGYDFLYSVMNPYQRDVIRRAIDQESRHLWLKSINSEHWGDAEWWWSSYRSNNWQMVSNGGLGTAAISLLEESNSANAYMNQSIDQCKLFMTTNFDNDGVYQESFGYYSYAMEYMLMFLDALKKNQAINLFHFRDDIIQKSAIWWLYGVVPKKEYRNSFDDDYGQILGTFPHFLKIASESNDGTVMWLWDQISGSNRNMETNLSVNIGGSTFYVPLVLLWYDNLVPIESPIDNLPLGNIWPEFGRAVFQTDFFNIPDAIQFYLQCGIGEFHGNHEDQGSFFLTAYGERLVGEGGFYGYQDSIYHNVILVDDVGQGVPYLQHEVWAEIPEYLHSQQIDYLYADMAPSYAYQDKNPVAEANRRVIFMRPSDSSDGYFVVFDDIDKGDGLLHQYDFLLHSMEGHTIESLGNNDFRFNGNNAALEIKFALPTDISFTEEIQNNVPLIRVSPTTGQISAEFLTLLFPTDSTHSLPAVTKINTPEVNGFSIEDDTILQKSNGLTISYNGITSDSEIVAIRDKDNSQYIAGFEGTSVFYNSLGVTSSIPTNVVLEKKGKDYDLTLGNEAIDNGMIDLTLSGISNGTFHFYLDDQYQEDIIINNNEYDFNIMLDGKQHLYLEYTDKMFVTVQTSSGIQTSNIQVEAYTEDNIPLEADVSIENDSFRFYLDDLLYSNCKFKVTYQGNEFWSQVITPETGLNAPIPIETDTVQVTVNSFLGPLENVDVCLFTESGINTGACTVTDALGNASFQAPVGYNYKFRSEINSAYNWSNVITVNSGGPNQAMIEAGGEISLTLINENGTPLRGVQCSVFTEEGVDMDITGSTGTDGLANFELLDGIYKIRISYRGVEYWTESFSIPGSTMVSLTVPSPTTEPEIGIYLEPVSFNSRQIAFIDAMKTARSWVNQSWNSSIPEQIPKDENGYPLELPYNVDGTDHKVMTTMLGGRDGHYPGGVYTVLYDGTGTLAFSYDAQVIQEEPGRILLQVNPTNLGILLRINSSQAGDHIRNIRVIMPGYEMNYSEQIFNPDFLSFLEGLDVLRLSRFSSVGSNVFTSWAERPTPSYYSQGTNKGVAIEHMIELANRLDKDIWISIPTMVDDNYVINCAQMLRDNLDPSLKIYLEYSYKPYAWSKNSFFNDMAALYNITNVEYICLRSAEIFKIFEEIFSGNERLIKIMSTYMPGHTGSIFGSFSNPEINPYAVSFDAIAIDQWYGDNISFGTDIADEIVTNGEVESISVEEILNRAEASIYDSMLSRMLEYKALTDANNVSLIAGAAGQYLVATGANLNNQTLTDKLNAANRHERMADLYEYMLEVWFNNGGGPFIAYSFVTQYNKNGSWGLLEYQDQLPETAPKYQAIIDYGAYSADTTPPVLTVPEDMVVEAESVDGTVLSLVATATDNTDPNPVITHDAPAIFPLGTTLVTFTATDSSGNSSSAGMTVTIQDTTPPILTVPVDITAEATGSTTIVDIGLATASDIFEVTITNDAPGAFPLGETTVTWTASDVNGNSTSLIQSVIIQDTIAPIPEVSPLPDVVAQCNIDLVPPLAHDNCSGLVTGYTSNPLSYSEPGNYTVNWYYADDQGNISSQVQNVIIQDTEPPVPLIDPLPDIVVQCSATLTPPAAMDNCSGEITATTTDPVNYDSQGTYTVTWAYEDSQGNISTQNQVVIINDTEPPIPVVDPLPDVIGECEVTLTPPLAIDDCSGEITATTTDPLTYTIAGQYLVIWIYDDGHGNTTTQEMLVIIENAPPSIGINAGPGIYEYGTDITVDAELSDCDGDELSYVWYVDSSAHSSGVIQAIAGGDPVQIPTETISDLTVGTHLITLEASDDENMIVESQFEVEIIDTAAPVLSPEVNEAILWPPNHTMREIVIQANAFDNTGGPVTINASVTSNEAQEGLWDGDIGPDWTEPVIDQELGRIELQLRSERAGDGEGREYLITIEAIDQSSNTSTAFIKVIVPHDKRKTK